MIRVTYSGLIAFLIGIISIFTGLLFSIQIARELSIIEFGTWGVINSVISYSLIITPIVSYWTSREIPRGEKTESTSLIFTSFLTLVGLVIFLLFSFLLDSTSDIQKASLIFAVILVPLFFFERTLVSINSGKKPQFISYGNLIFEISKVALVWIFLYVLPYGLDGVIFVIFISTLLKIGILFYGIKNDFRFNFFKSNIKKWIKFSWIPIYRDIPDLLQTTDVIIFSILTGSVVGVAYFVSARTIGYFVNHVRNISVAVYPKLLETEKENYFNQNLMLVFYFAFPLTAVSIVFAKPGLLLLNPIYAEGFPLVVFISLRMLLITLNKLFLTSAMGLEKIDKFEKVSHIDYIKSRLFWFPTADLIRHGIYIGVLTILLYFWSNEKTDLDLAYSWTLVSLLVEIPFTIYVIHIVKKIITIQIDYKRFFLYLLSSIGIFSIILIQIHLIDFDDKNLLDILISFIPYLIIGLISYFSITYIFDKKIKTLVKQIISSINKK